MSANFVDVLDRIDKLADVVRDGASESERLGCLAPPVFAALRDANLFRVLAPVEFGGLGLTTPEAVEATERVAQFDASTAWTLSILSGGAVFGRFFAPDVFEMMCSEPDNLAAGTLNPAQTRAEQVEGGFVFTGRGSYLSGSAHARWIMASAIVTEGGEPLLDEGMIQIRTGLIPIDQARSLDTWHVTGMRATGSTDYQFADVMVDEGRTFEPFRLRPTVRDDVMSAIPLWSQLGLGLAACAVGAARNMIDRFVELAATKVPAATFASLAQRPPAQIAVGEAEGLYRAARAVLLETVNDIWNRGVERAPFTPDVLAGHRVGGVTAVQLAARAIDLLHEAAGMNAVASDSVLDRCWRDVHTMTQHVILSTVRYETAGRVLLGLDVGGPLI